MLIFSSCQTRDPETIIDGYPVYMGDDLGVRYSPSKTTIRIWAPSATEAVVRLYDQGLEGKLLETKAMKKSDGGTWLAKLKGDKKNLYYTISVKVNNQWMNEVPDIYAFATGANGKRGMIVDFSETNPQGWDQTKKPVLNNFGEIVIWEIHTRDFSIHPSSGIKNKGKFLAFTETGTLSPEGLKTGLDHLVETGITHVHLLPSFDFHTIDETNLQENTFNWGYDPQNFNVPEGSYSTNPFDGRVRIREFKQMVQALHNNGIRLIMDVVFNHLYDARSSSFEQTVPGYYFRMLEDGSFSNGSGCGNETASEKYMMRKFIVESVLWWAREYKVDGFRFDLMGLHDIETMNMVREELNKIDTTIFIYGEGWTAGDSPLASEKRALKAHAKQMPGIAVFSDDIRDAIRGHWADMHDKGFMAGKTGLEESIRFGVVASTLHPQINYEIVNYSKEPYALSPLQTITYVTCHDNPCLWDKIKATCTDYTEKEMLEIQKLANAIVLTSQGVAFLHAGEEIVRTKFGEHNTYNLPDSINQLVWGNKARYNDNFQYYKKLIALRKNHPAFRMTSTEMIQKHLSFPDISNELTVGYQLTGHANGDAWENILVYYHAGNKDIRINIPEGRWQIVATKYDIEEKGSTVKGFDKIQEHKTLLPARSILILVNEESI